MNDKNGDALEFNLDRARQLARDTLMEDVGQGDITSRILVPPDEECTGVITVKEPAVLCGVEVAREVFEIAMVENGVARDRLVFDCRASDGEKLAAGTVIAEVRGNARAVLMAERTVLNFLQHLSGVATITRQFVDEVEKVSRVTRIFDTRKTMPLMRYLQKYAVRCGGGSNHRMGLWDMVLVKDNHHKIYQNGNMIEEIRKNLPAGVRVQVEVDRVSELKGLLMDRVDIVLLDNMSASQIAEAVKIIKGRCEIEVSGGVNLKNVREIAKLGVDRISIGALTHSVKAVDMGMEVTGL